MTGVQTCALPICNDNNPLVDGWFPTGDVATIDEEGYMQITDRSKDVIKSGGEWISSIDVENVAASDKERRLSLLEYRNREAVIERDRARTTLANAAGKQGRLDAEIEDLQAQVPAELQTPAAQELLESEVAVLERLSVVRDQITRFDGNRDPRAIQVHERAAAELAEHEQIGRAHV